MSIVKAVYVLAALLIFIFYSATVNVADIPDIFSNSNNNIGAAKHVFIQIPVVQCVQMFTVYLPHPYIKTH